MSVVINVLFVLFLLEASLDGGGLRQSNNCKKRRRGPAAHVHKQCAERTWTKRNKERGRLEIFFLHLSLLSERGIDSACKDDSMKLWTRSRKIVFLCMVA